MFLPDASEVASSTQSIYIFKVSTQLAQSLTHTIWRSTQLFTLIVDVAKAKVQSHIENTSLPPRLRLICTHILEFKPHDLSIVLYIVRLALVVFTRIDIEKLLVPNGN